MAPLRLLQRIVKAAAASTRSSACMSTSASWKNGRLDAAAMQTIARCGYDEYTVIDRVFSLARPAGGGNAFGGKGG
jgi:hypothetical protein